MSQNGWLTCMKLVQMCSNTQSAIIGGREQRTPARVHHEDLDHTRRSRGTNQQIFFIAEAWTRAHWALGRTFTRHKHQPGRGLELLQYFCQQKCEALDFEVFVDPSSIIQTMQCVRSECSAQALHKNPLQIIMSPCWGFAKHTSINHTNARPGARCPLWPGGHQQPHLAVGRRKSSESVRIFSWHTVSNPLEPWFPIS